MVALTDNKGRPRVVVSGVGMVTPCGVGFDASWDSLVSGRSGIDTISQFDCSAFDTKIAGEVQDFDPLDFLEKKEVRRNDRFIQFAVAAADMAMKDAGYTVKPSEAERVGCIVGAGLGGLITIEKTAAIMAERGPRKISPFFIPALIVNLAPGQISIRIGAKGPNWGPVSACSTSAHAIGEAVEHIRRGICDVMVTGGSEATITPLAIGGFNAMKALSTRNDAPAEASRPWDEDRDGFVMGEGAGLLVIESLEHALDRGAPIRAELVGYGSTADAYHITAPDGHGAVRCMRMALDDANLPTTSIHYVNAHGTSTPVGDVQEIKAIKEVFGEHATKLKVSSSKSMHGHTLGAAGAIETIVGLGALQHQEIPPTVNLHNPSPGCDLDLVANVSQKTQVDAILSNSFGFGGTNACLIAKRYVDA